MSMYAFEYIYKYVEYILNIYTYAEIINYFVLLAFEIYKIILNINIVFRDLLFT